MSVNLSHSPPDLSFSPRRPTFTIEQSLQSDWHGDSAFRTAFFNAMSCMFPVGEKFFIETVRAHRDQIDDERLLNEITAFQGQESVHRLEHQHYNEALCAARGYDLDKFEKRLRDRLAWVKDNLSERRQLAGTVAYEHLTAIMAHELLTNPAILKNADPEIARLWRWHAIEETEHKSVAFDVHLAVGGTIRERRIALYMNTMYFFKDAFGITRQMLKKDGKHLSIREWLSGMNFLFGKPGFLRRCGLNYFRYLRKGFHPWDHDNRNVIEDWKASNPKTAD
jgi:predicted metal-dependent hydrolase